MNSDSFFLALILAAILAPILVAFDRLPYGAQILTIGIPCIAGWLWMWWSDWRDRKPRR